MNLVSIKNIADILHFEKTRGLVSEVVAKSRGKFAPEHEVFILAACVYGAILSARGIQPKRIESEPHEAYAVLVGILIAHARGLIFDVPWMRDYIPAIQSTVELYYRDNLNSVIDEACNGDPASIGIISGPDGSLDLVAEKIAG